MSTPAIFGNPLSSTNLLSAEFVNEECGKMLISHSRLIIRHLYHECPEPTL